jgi:DNA polymerase III subunit epsilon
MELSLKRPIVFFDIESTGTQVAADRIVEICVLKINPDGTEEIKTRRINPTIPIPNEVSLIHGIYDEDIKDEPVFKAVAKSLADFIGDADLAGYNSNKFDVPMLLEEFYRAEIDFPMEDRRLIDVQNIFHQMEQRTLVAAYRFYCNAELIGAHGAEADVRATYEVLKAQLDRYQDAVYTDKQGNQSVPIVNDMQALADFSTNKDWVDFGGRMIYDKEGNELFNFGKHKGKKVIDVLSREPSYYDWMMNGDFALSTKKALERIKLRGLQSKFNS